MIDIPVALDVNFESRNVKHFSLGQLFACEHEGKPAILFKFHDSNVGGDSSALILVCYCGKNDSSDQRFIRASSDSVRDSLGFDVSSTLRLRSLFDISRIALAGGNSIRRGELVFQEGKNLLCYHLAGARKFIDLGSFTSCELGQGADALIYGRLVIEATINGDSRTVWPTDATDAKD